MVLLNNALRRQLEGPAVLAYLIYFCLDLFKDSERDIEEHWGMDGNEAFSLGIRSVPSLVGNLVAAQACAEKFGPDMIGQTAGFYKFNRSDQVCCCNQFSDLCVCELSSWRLDIDFYLSKRGLLLPVRDKRGLIVTLKVFRDAQDERPFTLRTRRELAA
ncbi:MAG: hypothetical protein ABJB61_06495 [bacterium]